MLRILELKGKDSPDFLHRVTAGSVRGLNPQEGRAGIFLNGQSRVLAQFEVLRLSQDQFLLAVPDECAEELRAGLEALHFSEALEIVWREGSAEAIPGNSRAVDAVFSFSMNEGF